jgi:hypothetical protein
MDSEHYIDGDHNGGVFNHFNHNSYGYCYQNPTRYIDPNGKQVDIIDFIPFVGSCRDIYRGIRDGDGTMVAIGVAGLALDIVTCGGGTIAKGMAKVVVKTVTKEIAETTTKVIAKKTALQGGLQGGGLILQEGASKHLLVALAKYEMKLSAKGTKTLNSIVEKARNGIGAGQQYKCVEYANSVAKKIGGTIKSIGNNINVGDGGPLGYGDNHHFVEKVVEGKTFIFDNLNPEGILKSDYIKKIDGYNLKTREVVSGSDLVNGAKTVDKAK